MKKFFFPLVVLFIGLANVNFAKAETFQLSTHILDISRGTPAPDVEIVLYKKVAENWVLVSSKKTDKNGRIADFLPQNKDNSGVYKLHFKTEDYFKTQNLPTIYPFVDVVFKIKGNGHYHIPITMSANGYATYRGN